MCQLLGMNANTPTDVMFSFAGLACRADEHKDGFGIAFFEGRGLRHFIDCQSARSSPVAELVKRWPIRSEIVIAHIRKATQGRVALENTHPFVRELWGRYWVFAHNGDLKGFEPRLHAAFRPVGDTDSEQAFCWLLDQLCQRFAEKPPTLLLTAAIGGLFARLAEFGTFNCLLSNGELLFAHCTTNLHYIVRQAPFSSAHLIDNDISVDFSALTTPVDRVAIIATQPLTDNEQWTRCQPGEYLVFVDGQRLSAMES